MAVAAVTSPLGSGISWVCGRGRRNATVGGGDDAGRGDRNAGALEREIGGRKDQICALAQMLVQRQYD